MNNPGMSVPGGPSPPAHHLPETKKKKCCKAKTSNGTSEAAKRGRKKKPVDDKKTNKKKFGKKGVTVTSQAREIVYNVINHFKKEAKDKCNSHPFENWLKRSVAATGLSKSTLQRIIKEVEKPAVKPELEEPKPPSVKDETNQTMPLVGPPHHHMPPMLEPVKLEQYDPGIIKHFTTNFMHHNMHHHHPIVATPHHLLQPIHHGPMPPPPQPPNPVLSHPHNPSHTHLHL